MPGFRFEKKKEGERTDWVFIFLVIVEVILLLAVILGYLGIIPLI